MKDYRHITEPAWVEGDGVLACLGAGQMVVPDNPARYGISHAAYLREHGLAEFQRAYRAGELPRIVASGETAIVNLGEL